MRRIAGRAEVGLGLLLVALTLAVYARTIRYGFVVFDDPRYVTENFHVLDGLTVRGLRWAFTRVHDSNWIPLTWISLMLDATLYDRWAGGYHATNLLLHMANVLLAFVLFNRATGKTLRSAFIAALLAAHPLHVESVAWITERKDVLSMLFGLLSLCAYVQYSRRRHRYGLVPRWRHRGWLVTAFALFVVSLASKQTLVTLPFVYLLLDFWPLGRIAGGPQPAREEARQPVRRLPIAALLSEKIPFLVVSAAFCAVALMAQSRGHAVRSLIEMSLPSRVLNAVLASGLYLQRAVAPVGLAIFYPHPGASLSLARVALAFAVLAAITGFAIARARRWPFVLVGWLWFLGTLVPMIGLVQVGLQQMADRYAYFPYLGLYVALAWSAPAIASSAALRKRVLPTIAGGVIAVYAATAFVQVGYWSDGITLMTHSLTVTGDNSFGRSMLGDALMAESRVDEAFSQYQQSLELSPADPTSHGHLGLVLHNLKRYDAAADQYRVALELDEGNAEWHVDLGLALHGQSQYVAARREFERARQLDAKLASAYGGLALLCRTLGDFQQSTEYAEQAVQLDDDTHYYRRLIAWNLFDQGRPDDALDRLQQLAAESPRVEEVRADLALVQSMKSDSPSPTRQ
ncbi:MAG TPA: tetratricopeptide repeat protein [Planctomycetaceae bacterium]|nr:tetratricopeptide repeat protein [Planctomycetaceae bacterium]